MNDRHPAGISLPADPGAEYSYAGYDTAQYEQSAYGSYGTTDHGTVTAGDGWSTDGYDASTAAYQAGHDTGGYEAGAYATGVYDTSAYDFSAYGTNVHGDQAYGMDAYGNASYETGSYRTAGWDGHGTAENQSYGLIPQQPGPHVAEQGWTTPADGTGQWDVSAFGAAGWEDGSAYGQGHEYGADAYPAAAYDSGAYGTDAYTAQAYDAGVHAPDARPAETSTTAAYPGETSTTEAYLADAYAPDACTADVYAAQAPDADDGPAFHEQPTAAYEAFDAHTPRGSVEAEAFPAEAGETGAHEEPVFTLASEAEPEPVAAAPGPQGRGRRRSPRPRRSALLTVAAPSVAVLGVAGIAAASVIPGGEEGTAQAAPDTTEVKASPANTKLDTQLAGLREAGDDFADRASRTQERIDLKKRQEAERKRQAAEAARREALRPKFALPVEGFGISAYFGQAGINWMSVHTGLDFPVSYGTAVKAATDGTVRTQWNSSYGNMIIVTASDGTETWYCHLSSTRIRSGTVKAGTVIGYSGNSGNSTGPHLHFEVRPGGGSAIDPLSWFRSHGLEPS